MSQFDATWRPYREPIRATLTRTIGIAAVVGIVAALVQRRAGSFATAGILALWFSLGGHWVEIFYLNWLRPRLPRSPVPQAGARLLIWFVGGALLTLGMETTARQLEPGAMRLPSIWTGGAGFVCVELLVHTVFRLRGRPGFFSGDG